MVTQKEQKEILKTRRDKTAGYFFDMSKLTFTASVLTGSAPLFQQGASANIPYVLVGAAATVVFSPLLSRKGSLMKASFFRL